MNLTTYCLRQEMTSTPLFQRIKHHFLHYHGIFYVASLGRTFPTIA